jgi:hypothetical protein
MPSRAGKSATRMATKAGTRPDTERAPVIHNADALAVVGGGSAVDSRADQRVGELDPLADLQQGRVCGRVRRNRGRR